MALHKDGLLIFKSIQRPRRWQATSKQRASLRRRSAEKAKSGGTKAVLQAALDDSLTKEQALQVLPKIMGLIAVATTDQLSLPRSGARTGRRQARTSRPTSIAPCVLCLPAPSNLPAHPAPAPLQTSRGETPQPRGMHA